MSDSEAPVYSPWRAGWYAAKANLIPGLILQAAAIALLVAYYQSQTLREALGHVEQWKAAGGYAYSATSSAFFCGLLPWLFRMAIPSLRPRSPLSELIFGLVWWAVSGIIVDVFYTAQGRWWGTGTSVGVIAVKMLIDMGIYTPLWAAPANALLHLWKARGFPLKGRIFAPGWYRRIVLPNLLPNWMVWIPGVAVVYSLPPLLQLPVANLICCFWALLCISIAGETTEGP
ncbi:hypothetical protein KBB96_18775 [Luteolibacter ambystomatis]|uniref:Uncharacterized protein n=1 Tax=Luteolibacter ambystomatis TaxID=2824561 RepID=A0A975G8V1_9BACT|nr:hypothetical protein [Luteolibacter ambystomatis]QUE50891.1 hypothetical protein KBB96_18775 [Luteolibacter ambystomatis]